jgi:hypothetical protein
MHMGDNKSALNNSAVAAKVAQDLANATGGAIDTLVLNGDVWEQCIPAGTLEENPGDGFCSSVAKASRGFFTALLARVRVGKMVWVPGNHDLSLWKRLSDASKLPFHTAPTGATLTGASSPAAQKFFDVLFNGAGPLPAFSIAYPIFLVADAFPADFPYTMFTHGHLMDPLVQGNESEAVYLALKALGCQRPSIPNDPAETLTITQIAQATDGFTLSLWKQDSTVDYTYWNMIARRLAHPQSCPTAGQPTTALKPADHPSSPRDGQMPQSKWFLETAVTDPNLPTPVGSLRSTTVAPAFSKPSCFVFGHDHLGTSVEAGICGVPFQIYDSGGWTVEFDGHTPHSHALVWNDAGTTPTYLYLALK